MARANYDLPDEKLLRVVKAAGAKSKREAIIIALDEYLRQKKREELAEAFGKAPLAWTRSSFKRYRE